MSCAFDLNSTYVLIYCVLDAPQFNLKSIIQNLEYLILQGKYTQQRFWIVPEAITTVKSKIEVASAIPILLYPNSSIRHKRDVNTTSRWQIVIKYDNEPITGWVFEFTC